MRTPRTPGRKITPGIATSTMMVTTMINRWSEEEGSYLSLSNVVLFQTLLS
jgi:hypothetical protein